MMKKRLLSLLLAAAMLIGMLPAALAEAQHTPYTPGQLTEDRFAEAFAKGNAICADMGLSLAMNAETLDITGEDAEAMNLLLDALKNAQLSVAAVKLEDGLLLHLSGAYFKGEDYASLDAQLEITKTGLALTSDALIPGERVTVTWETLLAMCGVDEATAQQVLALRDMSFEEMAEIVTSTLSTFGDLALQIATPYAQILSDFVAGLPVSVAEDVAADDPFPAAAKETTIIVTEKATGELIVALCNQLEADATLAPMIDAYFASSADPNETPITTAALCAVLREDAADMTDEESPLYIITGTDAGDGLLYLNVSQVDEDGSAVVFNCINTAATPDETAFHLEAVVADTQQTYTGLSCDVQYTGDPADPNVADLHVNVDLATQAQSLLSAAFDLTLDPALTEDGMSGYQCTHSYTVTIADEDEPVSMSAQGEASSMLTPEGGELIYFSYILDTQAGDLSMRQTVEETIHLMEDENGPLVELVELMTMPDTGIDEAYFYAQAYTLPYAPDTTLTEWALDSASAEAMDALLVRATVNLQAQAEKLLELLPPELIAYFADDEEAPAESGI